MHGHLRVIVSSLLLVLSSLAEAGAVEGVPRTQFTFKTPGPVVYELEPLAKRENEPRWQPARERDRPEARVRFGSQIILRLAKGHALGLSLIHI